MSLLTDLLRQLRNKSDPAALDLTNLLGEVDSLRAELATAQEQRNEAYETLADVLAVMAGRQAQAVRSSDELDTLRAELATAQGDCESCARCGGTGRMPGGEGGRLSAVPCGLCQPVPGINAKPEPERRVGMIGGRRVDLALSGIKAKPEPERREAWSAELRGTLGKMWHQRDCPCEECAG